MFSRRLRLLFCAACLAIMANHQVRGQQAAAPPSNPSVASAAPGDAGSIASLLTNPGAPMAAPRSRQHLAQSLEAQINAIGRVSWSTTARNKATNEVTSSVPSWGEDSVAIDPSACRMRWNLQINGGYFSNGIYFVEAFRSIEAIALDDLMNRGNQPQQYSASPMPYFVRLEGNYTVHSGSLFPIGIYVHDLAGANQIADGFRALVQRCQQAVPPAGPALQAVLNDLAQKLNQQGGVSWMGVTHDAFAGTISTPWQSSELISAAKGDPSTCLLTFNKELDGSTKLNSTVSLRRISKIEVMGYQDWWARLMRSDDPGGKVAVSPPVWSVVLTDEAGGSTDIAFSGEAQAEGVARDFQNAAQACAAWETPELF